MCFEILVRKSPPIDEECQTLFLEALAFSISVVPLCPTEVKASAVAAPSDPQEGHHRKVGHLCIIERERERERA